MKRTNKIAMKIYTLTELMLENEPFWPQFSFHATDDSEAREIVNAWARYQGFSSRDVDFRPATSNEIEYWIHDEFIDSFRSK